MSEATVHLVAAEEEIGDDQSPVVSGPAHVPVYAWRDSNRRAASSADVTERCAQLVNCPASVEEHVIRGRHVPVGVYGTLELKTVGSPVPPGVEIPLKAIIDLVRLDPG